MKSKQLLQNFGCIGIHKRKLLSWCDDPYLGPGNAQHTGLERVMLFVCPRALLLDVRRTIIVDSH
jgi:hypothetical protein